MRIDDTGIDFIRSMEGFWARPYKDMAGHPTIGYGHLILKGEMFSDITENQARVLLIQDLKRAESSVHQHINMATTTQSQYNALVSFAFNLGGESLNDTVIAKLHNAGKYTAAASQFGRWIYVTVDGQHKVCQGLVSRRAKEALMYRGIYHAD